MRNVELTKQRILEAATEEFSAHGYSGARVDRIAASAAANKALIYSYFGNKEKLFEAVFQEIMTQVVRDVRMDAFDLAGYLERRLEWQFRNPTLARIATWAELDSESLPHMFTGSDVRARKVSAIVEAQQAGAINDEFTPEQVLLLIDSLARPGLVLRGEKTVPLEEFERYKLTAVAALRKLIAVPEAPVALEDTL